MLPFIRLMRLDKPIGILLVLWPVLWALWLANQGLPSLQLLVIFILGSVIMRSAGCVINDICDRNFDSQVKRTQMRPLAQHQLSLTQAWCTFAMLMLLALFLVLQLNTLTQLLAVIAALLTCFYPLCKRFTHLPQVVLGITFNFGVLMAFTASVNQIPLIAWILFVTSALWTIGYDTLYAMVDKPDDLQIGVRSTAVLFGAYALPITYVLYGLFFSGMLLIGYLAQLHFIFVFMLFLAVLWTYYHLFYARRHTTSVYFKVFLSNNMTGMLIFIGIFSHYYLSQA